MQAPPPVQDKRYILIGDQDFEKLGDHCQKFGNFLATKPDDVSDTISKLLYCVDRLPHKVFIYSTVLHVMAQNLESAGEEARKVIPERFAETIKEGKLASAESLAMFISGLADTRFFSTTGFEGLVSALVEIIEASSRSNYTSLLAIFYNSLEDSADVKSKIKTLLEERCSADIPQITALDTGKQNTFELLQLAAEGKISDGFLKPNKVILDSMPQLNLEPVIPSFELGPWQYPNYELFILSDESDYKYRHCLR